MDTVEFYARYGIKDAKTVDKIYNLILGSPGNYLKYYIGYIKFLELKKEWIKSGNQSQKEFHKAVLSVGPAQNNKRRCLKKRVTAFFIYYRETI